MNHLSVAIITYNEEKNIEKCLSSLIKVADEIVIVDSYSTDKTVSIAKEYNAKIYSKEFMGYAEQKNYANSLCSHELILSLDADEVLSDELLQSINIAKQELLYDAYSLKRLTNYAGSWVYHCGWYPDKKIRLFKKSVANWSGPKLHELLVLDKQASLGQLKGDLLHYSFHTEADHLKQIEKFTNISSLELYNKGKKATFYHLYIKPVFRFLTDYIYKLGLLDGGTGFTICKNSAYAVYLKYYKLRKLENEHRTS